MVPAQYFLPLKRGTTNTIDDLRDWAIKRLELHLKRAIEEEKISWEKNPRKSGVWEDGVDFETCIQMCLQSLEWHLQEVSRCLEEKPVDLFNLEEGNREYCQVQMVIHINSIRTIRLQGMVINSFRGLGYRKAMVCRSKCRGFCDECSNS